MLTKTPTPTYLYTQPVIADYPALCAVEADLTREFGEGEVFAIERTARQGFKIYSQYTLGSVAGYAKQYNEDPDEAVARETERKHPLYWANHNASVMTAWKQDKKYVPVVKYGDVIRFAGKQFRLVPAWNDNVSLVEVAE